MKNSVNTVGPQEAWEGEGVVRTNRAGESSLGRTRGPPASLWPASSRRGH